jgi:UDP-N-acetyl-2-amino-2-deoxyglucuronate dehydrogenase
VNVGIIGGGNISETHARAAEAAGLHVAAVFGENRDKTEHLAQRHGAVAYATLDDLLRHPALDVVLIGSPSGCHAAQAAAAARAGCHVLVEKPLDITTARIDALLDEVTRAGITLGVFFQDRLKPDVVLLKRLLDEERIGAPVMATGEVKWFRPPEYYAASRWRGTWALDGGGALMNQGIHTLDLLLYLLGPVVRVSGDIGTRFHRIEAEDTAVAALHFANGAVGTIEATTAAYPGRARRVHVVGSHGSLLLEGDQLEEVRLADSAAGTGVPAPGDERSRAGIAHGSAAAPENAASPVVSDIAAHQRMIEDFVDAIQRRRAPVCDGREGRRSVEVVEAIYRSARERAVIEL